MLSLVEARAGPASCAWHTSRTQRRRGIAPGIQQQRQCESDVVPDSRTMHASPVLFSFRQCS